MPRRLHALAVAVTLLAAGRGAALAQEMHGHRREGPPPAVRFRGSAQGILLLTHAAPAVAGEGATEAYLTQPNLMAHADALGGLLAFAGTLNLEGLTLRRGELNAGGWGEGYIDRRHPHTYLHEAVLSANVRRDAAAASLSVGKGFVPFGTDDPMMRPFVKYPSNHHLSQLLERAVVIGALRYGPVILEGALFDGDEPTGPTDWPNLDRFGDSRAARLTIAPADGLELQASHAFVASPEHDTGGGLDQSKWSASVHFDRPDLDWSPYAHLEWALTRDGHPGQWGYAFHSLLAEAAVRRGSVALAARLESSERPEEERLLRGYPFRSPRPAPDLSILARSRWQIATANVTLEPAWTFPVRVAPFAEISLGRVRSLTPGSLFDAREVYGSDRLWSLSVGARLATGHAPARMGRYGVAASPVMMRMP